jgi:hypothetical protein
MKDRIIPVFALGVLSLFFLTCAGAGPVVGVIAPLNNERVTIVRGEKAVATVGQNAGIIKGDVGYVSAQRGGDPNNAIAQCAVTSSDYRSSVCEVVKNKREIDAGSFIFFDAVTCADPTLCRVAVGVLSHTVEPYEPYKRLRVCLYGVFDAENRTTAMGERIMGEMRSVFAGKKRIELVSSSALDNFVFYPGSDGRILGFVQGNMKRTGIDVLITGRYGVAGKGAALTVSAIGKEGLAREGRFDFALEEQYRPLISAVVSGPKEPTAVEASTCLVTLRTTPVEPLKHEKVHLIRQESGGNVMVERALKRVDFNLVNAVDVKVTIDGEAITPAEGKGKTVTLPNGAHRVVVSFRRGYFFNESLLYTSQQEVRREVLLELGTPHNLVMDVRLSPFFRPDSIGIDVYRTEEKQRQVIRPIYKVEAQNSIEVFKD